MPESSYRLSYTECRSLLQRRLAEPAPGRIQLLAGPRQVGKTTLLLELAQALGGAAIYLAADAPEASLPGAWERLWTRAEDEARARRRAIVVLLDEVQHVHDWAARLKAEWDRLRRRRVAVHVVASGSSALHLGRGSRESLAGRFERITLTHWSAASLAAVFHIARHDAAELLVRQGSYPGSMALRSELARWSAYVRDAIVEPAIGRDILALSVVRRPALLRQVFSLCVSSPAHVVALQKLRGQLQDAGALETIAQYLVLLEEAFLVASLTKHSAQPIRRRSAPPKLVTLNNALLAAVDPRGIPDPLLEPARFGSWVENACLAHAWNAGQRVAYWREEPFDVDGVLDGSWGKWAVEVKSGAFDGRDLRGLVEFGRRFRAYRPLVLCPPQQRTTAERSGIEAMDWRDFLLSGPPG
jgi:predicted AAA+ superfamily ATPase